MEDIHLPHILIVEDRPDDALTISLLLQHYGMTCESAGTLAAGLARLAQGGVDCVVLDLTLPDAHNLDAAHTLQERFPSVPFVINTGYRALAIEAISAGAQDVMVKPADPAAWEDRILYAIARHRVRASFQPVVEALEQAKATADALVESVKPGSGRFGTIVKPEGGAT